MKRLFVKSKIHRATVTDANLDYEGSISIDPVLLEQAGMLPYEFVHVNNVRNGVHWETYIIPGQSGEITLNGPPAHHFSKDDKIVIFTLADLLPSEISSFYHTVVYVDQYNDITKRVQSTIFNLDN
jgi:aspartate 1-decarboxylase